MYDEFVNISDADVDVLEKSMHDVPDGISNNPPALIRSISQLDDYIDTVAEIQPLELYLKVLYTKRTFLSPEYHRSKLLQKALHEMHENSGVSAFLLKKKGKAPPAPQSSS